MGETLTLGLAEARRQARNQASYRRIKKWRSEGKRKPEYGRAEAGFLGIDGEGYTDPVAPGKPAGTHRYTLLAASDGSYIRGRDLSTVRCLDYLLSLGGFPGVIVGFSINYDICMMLRDLDDMQLAELWYTKWTEYNGYRINYIPGREFYVSRGEQKVRIYDVFGFFQTSFVRALEDWHIGDNSTVDIIARMKAARGTFSEESEQEILEYCLSECRLLVQLMDALYQTVAYADIPIRRWYGAGALASGLLERQNVKDYMGELPGEYKDAIMRGYFGGRFEISESGVNSDVWGYDIRSAYPHIATSLPCTAHMRYARIPGRKYDPNQPALWRVKWNVSEDSTWTPFPMRDEARQIWYCLSGKGWYYYREVAAAIQLFGDQIEVLEGIGLYPECDHRPFGFIPELYEYRAKLRAEGNRAHYTIKLGLNSLYGKTAQSVGYKGRKPTYQNYLWAGLITSGTRAMILEALKLAPNDIFSIATDGILSKSRLPLALGTELGKWEESHYDQTHGFMPGVYETLSETDSRLKTRGFSPSEVDWEEAKRVYERDPVMGQYRYHCVRFIGLGAALSRAEFRDYFAHWVPMERHISFFPAKRWPRDGTPPFYTDVRPPIRYAPPPNPGCAESQPFRGKDAFNDVWTDRDSDIDTLVDLDQPL